MSERLRPRDLAILATESPTTPMHNATVEIFDPGDGRGAERGQLGQARGRVVQARAAGTQPAQGGEGGGPGRADAGRRFTTLR